eukprot:TRINITY_DN10730_c1_g1_i3.p1 TRINITY_DN10730_c1_g1~~TRINITY_DN10730_c1_g1_i3.p1  ORF type:complete len:319 (+),score=-12.31 TRINITY_DN10730_c1_g1_i3:152-1108(+)
MCQRIRDISKMFTGGNLQGNKDILQIYKILIYTLNQSDKDILQIYLAIFLHIKSSYKDILQIYQLLFYTLTQIISKFLSQILKIMQGIYGVSRIFVFVWFYNYFSIKFYVYKIKVNEMLEENHHTNERYRSIPLKMKKISINFTFQHLQKHIHNLSRPEFILNTTYIFSSYKFYLSTILFYFYHLQPFIQQEFQFEYIYNLFVLDIFVTILHFTDYQLCLLVEIPSQVKLPLIFYVHCIQVFFLKKYNIQGEKQVRQFALFYNFVEVLNGVSARMWQLVVLNLDSIESFFIQVFIFQEVDLKVGRCDDICLINLTLES